MAEVQLLTNNGFASDRVEDHARFGPSALEQLWESARAHKWAVALICAICLIAGLLGTLFMTPQYTGSARIEISREGENVTNVEGLQPDAPGADLEFYETQYSLLQARSLAERVARAENLATNDDFFSTFGVDPDAEGLLSSDRPQGMTAQRRSQRLDLATDILLENVTIAPVRGSSLVDVRFTSPDPKLSAEIANVWVEQFIQANLDRRFASTRDARDFLRERLDQLREKLEQSERRLVDYASANEIVTVSQSRDSEGRTTDEQTLVGSNLEAMNAALAQARADRIRAESEFRQGRGLEEALSNPAINAIRQQRAEVAAERAKLLSQFEPEYPTVRALTSQLEALDRSIAQEEARVRSSSQADYAQALQRERELASQVEALKDRLIGENRSSIQYNIYQREVDTNRELYDALLQRFKEIGVAGVGSNNIAIIDRADVPDVPSSPNMALNLLISLLLGLTISGGYIFAREQIDQSLRDPADVKDMLGLALLGTVPDVEEDDVGENLLDRKSAVSEAYFSIGTTLSFLTDHGAPRSMLFTSTRPDEGKSTSAFAVAVALARTGKRVLLIDADLRNPTIHDLTGSENDRGLSNLLSGDERLEELAHKTISGADVLPAGPIPPAPSELLASDRMIELIRSALVRYDHVMLDGPPVLGIADVPLLARSVEGVIYNIRANGAKFRAIQSALDRLKTSNAHIFGAIVTRVGSRNASYGYGYGYGYGHGYGRNPKEDEVEAV